MDTTYQVDGKECLNDLFAALLLFKNKQKNAQKIADFVAKTSAIWEYFGVQYSLEKTGRLQTKKCKIRNLDEVAALPGNYVFNCLGATSYKVFPDENLKPIKGSMVYFKNKDVEDYYHVQMDDGHDLLILPSFGVLAIGVTKSFEAMDPVKDREILDRLYQRALRFFKPKL